MLRDSTSASKFFVFSSNLKLPIPHAKQNENPLTASRLEFISKSLRIGSLLILILAALFTEFTLNFNHVTAVLGGPNDNELHLPAQLLPLLIGAGGFIRILWLKFEEWRSPADREPSVAARTTNRDSMLSSGSPHSPTKTSPTTGGAATASAVEEKERASAANANGVGNGNSNTHRRSRTNPPQDLHFLQLFSPALAIDGPGEQARDPSEIDALQAGRPAVMRYLVAWLPWLSLLRAFSNDEAVEEEHQRLAIMDRRVKEKNDELERGHSVETARTESPRL